MRTAVLFVLLLFVSNKIVCAKELIAYSHLSEDGYWQIWEMSPDGSGQHQITHSKEDKREPSWLADGRLTYRTNNGKLYLHPRDDSGEQEILTRYQPITNPQFSRDTRSVLFVRFDPRVKDIRDIWKSDLSGENAVILTKDNKLAFQPAFSPDDRRVVFVKADDTRQNHHLWIMDADGNNARQLTTGKGQDLMPKFSPDGRQVVFYSNRSGGNFEIYALNLDHKKIQRLTRHEGIDSNPCFSPDGRKICFVSNRSGSQHIWVMDHDGSNPLCLTGEQGESLEPYWADINEDYVK